MVPFASQNPQGKATLADLLAISESQRYHELIDGNIARKATPSAEHGTAQRKLGAMVEPFDRRPGGKWPGGWWLMTEVEVMFAPNQTFPPDLVGWRRDKVPERPRGMPVEILPDWVGEIVSESNASNDRVTKLNAYHRYRVQHYWIVDPSEETLAAYRWTPDGYLLVVAATSGQRVRVEPFDAIEIEVAEIFGHE